MMSYLHTKFHENRISSFRGVAMTRFWDGRTDGRTDRQTDGVTALLDLLSPLAKQVKSNSIKIILMNMKFWPCFLLEGSKRLSIWSEKYSLYFVCFACLSLFICLCLHVSCIHYLWWKNNLTIYFISCI